VRFSEWIALSYFVYLAAVASRAPAAAPRRWVVVAAAAAIAGFALAVSRVSAESVTSIVRDWTPLLYLAFGYWLPGLLVRAPDERLERALLRFDRRWLPRIGSGDTPSRAVGGAPARDEPRSTSAEGRSNGWWRRLFVEWVELNYLLCYPLAPIGFACLYLAGLRGEADRFWTAVLLAALPCYGALPWLPARPPRVVDKAPARPSTVRTLNLHILERASVRLNTLPSAHVASSTATALAVFSVLPAAGLFLGLIAGGIAIGSIVGRYHYLADVIAGAAVAVAAFLVSRTT
jgi:hypothetical protein